MRGRWGPITAAVDGPGGPISRGDQRRRDSTSYDTPMISHNHKYSSHNSCTKLALYASLVESHPSHTIFPGDFP